jgi:hypothetical protein
MEAAKNQTAIRDIHVFAGEWETERAALAKIYEHCSSNAERPYWIKESDEYGLDELLSPELLKKRIDHWRSIELETQMSTDLELGEINDPSEFIPHDDDWT